MYADNSNAKESQMLAIVVPTVVLGVLIIVMTVILTSTYVYFNTKKTKLQIEKSSSQSTEIPIITDKNKDTKDDSCNKSELNFQDSNIYECMI